MDKNWIDLLSLFDRYGVKYLIVGGWAVTFYTQPRFTKDLDLFIEGTRENAEATYRALAAYGAPLSGMTVEDFQDANSIFQIGLPPRRIDILNAIPDIEFASAWDSRYDTTKQGVPVHYIGKDDLIRNKQASGRLQDLADAEAIQNADKATGQSPSGTSK